MVKKILVILLLLSLAGFASAAISLSEPQDVYNLGDRLYVTASGLVGANSGNLNLDLSCGNSTVNLVRIPARAFAGDTEQSYSIPYKVLDKRDLEIEDLNSIIGSCQVLASIGPSATSSKTFTITDDILLNLGMDKESYNPGEQIKITILAVKPNGALLNGFIQVTGAVDFEKAIENGEVSEVFSMPETTEAGIYSLNVSAYDTDESGVLNTGIGEITFKINQVATSIIPSLSENDVIPGTELTVGAEIFDQAGQAMEGTISATIISPTLQEKSSTFSSGDFTSFDFSSNATAGEWELVLTFGELKEIREFNILELQKVTFDVEDGILKITNIGNAVYSKTIEVTIGEETRELNLNVGIGETRKFNLKAPPGEYEVSVNDGENSITKRTLLTGRAISIKDLKGYGIIGDYLLLWIFLILIILITIVILILRKKKGKTPGKGGEGIPSKISGLFKSRVPKKIQSGISDSMHFTKKSPASLSLDSTNHHSEDKSLMDMTKKGTGNAESTVVLKGEKSPSTVVSIRIRNPESLNENSISELKKIINSARAQKGLVDWRSDYIFVIFSPMFTRTYNNEILAVKAASKIADSLRIHNKKFNNKIQFNVGVHSGQLVASKEGEKLKYTGIGNTVSFAKRISDSDNEKVLVSEEVRKKMLRDLKTERNKQIGEKWIYSISEIKNREANEAKLKDLLKRMKQS